MQIFIPTKQRRNLQLTLKSLPKELRAVTTVVCPEDEIRWLRQDWIMVDYLAQPDPKMGIAEKRKWIVETAKEDKIVMLDDDLRFAVRRTDNPTLFRAATDIDILQGFEELEEILSPEVPHAGFSARGMGISASAQEGGWQEGKRMVYVLGYYVPTVLVHAEFGRINTREDMDITLQLLTKGFPNLVNFSFVVDQKFGNPGGCSNERTIEKSNRDAQKLAEFFPSYVRVTPKEYKSSIPRLEVVCQWQKALRDGRQNRG